MDKSMTQSEIEIKNSKCLCVECQKLFSKPSNLKLHIKRKHPDKLDVVRQMKLYICDECGEQITTKVELKIHQRCHSSQVNNNSYVYICPICEFKETKNNLIAHFNEQHDIQVLYENLEFSTMDDFSLWKNKLEIENVVKFVKKRGIRQGNKISSILFYCHRSGIFRNEGSGKRHAKVQGSCKINGFCPAELKVKILKDKCKVVYCKTHVGHTLDLEHIHLSSTERKKIAAKIARKIPFSNILNEVRDSVTNCKLQRLHFLNRKDLYNIEKSFKLNNLSVRSNVKSKKGQNDVISVEAFVNDKQNNECVLIYQAEETLADEDMCNTDKKEKTNIFKTNNKKNINKETLQKEVAQYLQMFVDYTKMNITTYEEFNTVKKLLAPVQPTLAAMKNVSGVLPKEVENFPTNRSILH